MKFTWVIEGETEDLRGIWGVFSGGEGNKLAYICRFFTKILLIFKGPRLMVLVRALFLTFLIVFFCFFYSLAAEVETALSR